MGVLIPQLNEEVELILVDDGCDEVRFDKYKDKVDIVHLDRNYGNSRAINTGIKKAIGKYIAIIDSDDMVMNFYVEEVLIAINNYDVDMIEIDWEDMYSGVVVHRPSNQAPWRSVYKKEIMPLFDENIRHSNDVPFRRDLDEDNKTHYYIEKVLYIYNSNRVGSLTWEKERGDYS